MNKIIHNEKGTALIVTLAIAAILLTAGLEIGRLVTDSIAISANEKDRFQAEQLALSGIHLGTLLLLSDVGQDSLDSVQENWANKDKLLLLANELASQKEKLEIEIIDELSKIQINALLHEFPGHRMNHDQHRIWEHLLRLRFSSDKSMDARDPAQIINTLKDWLDSLDDDAITGLSGAESDYYMGLDPPYLPMNGPLKSIDELWSIKAISPDLLKTEFNDINGDLQVLDLSLEDIFTVYGMNPKKTKKGGFTYSGKININTAGPNVLAAILPEGKEEQAFDLVNYRSKKNDENVFINRLSKNWYKKVIDLSSKEQKQFERCIVYSSDIFTVKCIAEKNRVKVKLSYVVKREKQEKTGKWICRTLKIDRE